MAALLIEIVYRRTSDSCGKKVMKELGKLVEKYKDNLMDKGIDYLTNFSYNTSNFYGLPKVHKSDIITQAIIEQNSEYIKILVPEDLTVAQLLQVPIVLPNVIANSLTPLSNP